MDKLTQAKKILVNYFQAVARAANLPWESDYSSEIETAVDLIFEAAVEEATKKLDFHLQTGMHTRKGGQG